MYQNFPLLISQKGNVQLGQLAVIRRYRHIHRYRRIQRVTLDVYIDIGSNPNVKGPHNFKVSIHRMYTLKL